MTPNLPTTHAPRATRATVLLAAGGALLVLAMPAMAVPEAAVISVVFSADDLGFNVTSSKDISNVIVEFCDGSRHKHDGLDGHTFDHTENQSVAAVFVKSGNNGIAGNDPPGAGERFENAGACDSQTTTTTTSTTGTTTGSDTETTTGTEVPFFGGAPLAMGLGVVGALGGALLMLRRRL